MRLHHCFGFVFITACSSGSSSTTTETSATEATSFCDRSCARAHECKADDPNVSCSVNCQKDYDRVFARMHADARSGLLECMESTSCEKLVGEGAGHACLDGVLANLPQRESVTEMCQVMGDRMRECKGRLDESSCRTAKLFNEEVIASARSCAEKPCEEVPDCWRAVFVF